MILYKLQGKKVLILTTPIREWCAEGLVDKGMPSGPDLALFVIFLIFLGRPFSPTLF